MNTNKLKFDQAKVSLLSASGTVLVGLKGKIVLVPQPSDKLAQQVHLGVVPDSYPTAQYCFDFNFDVANPATEQCCTLSVINGETTSVEGDRFKNGELVTIKSALQSISAHLSWFDFFVNEAGYTLDSQVYKVEAGKTQYTVYVEDDNCDVHEVDCGKSSAKFMEALLLLDPDAFQSIEHTRYSRATLLSEALSGAAATLADDAVDSGTTVTKDNLKMLESVTLVDGHLESLLMECGQPLVDLTQHGDVDSDDDNSEKSEDFTYAITNANVSFLVSTGDGEEDYNVLYSIEDGDKLRYFIVSGERDEDVESDEPYLNGEIGYEVSLHSVLDYMISSLQQCECDPEIFVVHAKTFEFVTSNGVEVFEFRGSKSNGKVLSKLLKYLTAQRIPAVRTLIVHPQTTDIGVIAKSIETFINNKKNSLDNIYEDLLAGIKIYGTIVSDTAMYSFLGQSVRVVANDTYAVTENVPVVDAIRQLSELINASEKDGNKDGASIEAVYDTMVCTIVSRMTGSLGERLRQQDYSDKLVTIVNGEVTLESDIASFINKNIRNAINAAYEKQEDDLENLMMSLRSYAREIKNIIAEDDSEG